MKLGSNILSAIEQQIFTLGKEELHKKFPRDFELYMCAIELVDENDFPVDYFMFPIMPKNISKSETEATTMQHSFSGITIFNKAGFIPDELNIQGDFGRSFKLLSSTKGANDNFAYDYKAVLASTSIEEGYYTSDNVNDGFVNKQSEFPFGVKTGYGCTKILQSIIHKAKSRGASGKTYKLYFYNPALGENYLVIPNKNPLTLSQNEQGSNMIWQYTLSLLIIADLNDVEYRRTSPKQMSYAFTADKLLGGITTSSSWAMSYRNMIVSTRK
jgi:hypothetical protein